MKKLIYTLLLVGAMIVPQSLSAQLKTSYFMEGSYFRTDMNPALTPTRGYLALTHLSGFTFGSYSNYNSYMNYYRDGEYVDAFDPSVSANEFLGKLPNKCTQAMDYNISLFKVGFYTLNGTFWNIGSNFRVAIDYTTPKEYYKILKSDYPDGITAKNVHLDGNAYLENYIGRTFRLGDNITLGARAKLLIGLYNINFHFNKIAATNNQFYVDGSVKMASVLMDSSRYDGEKFPEVLESEAMSSILDNVKSFGGAIDLGAEVRLFDNHLKVSGAITDLGFIKWSKDTMFEGTMTASYDHKNAVENILNIMDEDIMEIPRFFSAYATRLITNINLGVEYNFLKNHFSVGALSHTRILHGGVMSEFTASFNVRPTNWMSLTASRTFFNGNVPGTYGLAVNLHPRAINIFFGMDYISGDVESAYGDFLTTFPSLYSDAYPSPNSYNLYFGVGFNFGRPDFLINQY